MEDVADENISPATVSNLERGVSHVKQEKMYYLLDKLGISIDKLPELIIDQKEELERESSTYSPLNHSETTDFLNLPWKN